MEAVNYYHKELHLGCFGSPRSASGYVTEHSVFKTLFNMLAAISGYQRTQPKLV